MRDLIKKFAIASLLFSCPTELIAQPQSDWVLLYEKGPVPFSTDGYQVFYTKNSISQKSVNVWSIYLSRIDSGRSWMGSNNGFYLIDCVQMTMQTPKSLTWKKIKGKDAALIDLLCK